MSFQGGKLAYSELEAHWRSELDMSELAAYWGCELTSQELTPFCDMSLLPASSHIQGMEAHSGALPPLWLVSWHFDKF